jgi:hypothetical protein
MSIASAYRRLTQDHYLAVRWILRYGFAASLLLSLAAGAGATYWLWPSWGLFALPVALVITVLTFVLCKSYVEMVGIVFQMVN